MNTPMAYSTDVVARKSNAVLSAQYKLTMNEQRILFSVLAQLHNNEPATDQKMYFVYASDIESSSERGGNAFKELREASNSLFNRVVTIDAVPNGASKIRTAGTLRTRWIQSEVIYFEGKGKIGLRLSHDILPYINQLRRDFSRIPVQPLISMTSIHAARIFELLMQFRDTGMLKIKADELKRRLDVLEKYKKFSDFKRTVLDTAVKQINEHAGIAVSYELKREGKTVDEIIFRFTRDSVKKIKDKVEKSSDASKGSDAENAAMKILSDAGYSEVSLDRINTIMGTFKTLDPIMAVTKKIQLDKQRGVEPK